MTYDLCTIVRNINSSKKGISRRRANGSLHSALYHFLKFFFFVFFFVFLKKLFLLVFSSWSNDQQASIALSVKIRQSSIYHAGSLRRWDERLIDQASDVPSIFFHNFLQKSLLKSFQFIFFL